MIQGSRKSEKEYRKLERLSSTDIRTFATKGRKEFYKRVILKEKEEDIEQKRGVMIGSLVHCLLLEPQEFEKKYYMSVCDTKPTGNMLAFVQALFKHTLINMSEDGEIIKDFSYLAEEAYRESGYKRDKLETVLSNFIGKDPEHYYKELRDCYGTERTVACMGDIGIAKRVVERIRTHEYTKDLFGSETQKEVQIEEFEIDGLPMKAMIDDISTDGIYLQPTDLKVVWDNENFYEEYFLKKRADIQAYIYTEALKKTTGKLVKPLKFVVADSTNFNAPYIYPMSQEILDNAYFGFDYKGRHYLGVHNIIEEIKWHNEFGKWDTSREAYKNNGIITL